MIKTVITAAGKGTRLLPAAKDVPKEMMPIFSTYDKQRIAIPLLQFIFEQLYDLNIRNYCFVIGRDKRVIKDHFTSDYTYLRDLSMKYKILIRHFYKKIERSNLVWINQSKPLGFGDAVRRTERYVGNDNCIVHAGDVSIIGKAKHPVLRLIETAKRDPSVSAVLLFKKVKDARRYGVPKITKISNAVYMVHAVEEKPLKPKFNIGLLPIYYFKPNIFTYLKKIKPGKNGELQLTDAIQKLIDEGEKVVAISLFSNEFEVDVGTVESYR
ncbi:MAG: sugar phosphate nucleotidyltransferase, partial [Nitrosopumilaceae archaeon]